MIKIKAPNCSNTLDDLYLYWLKQGLGWRLEALNMDYYYTL